MAKAQTREEKLETRRKFRSVFRGQYGDEVLASILLRCGYGTIDEVAINPALIAFGQWLMDQMGGGIDTRNVIDSANDNDIPRDEEDPQ